MSILPLEQPGAAVLIVRSGEGQPWAAWFEVKTLIFCALNICPDSVNGSLQLCLAGKCPMLVPAHASPPELAVCTESVPPAAAAIPGRMGTTRDRGQTPSPVSSAPAASSEHGSWTQQNLQKTAHQVIRSRNGCWTAA